jgi:hypothetical protein
MHPLFFSGGSVLVFSTSNFFALFWCHPYRTTPWDSILFLFVTRDSVPPGSSILAYESLQFLTSKEKRLPGKEIRTNVKSMN